MEKKKNYKSVRELLYLLNINNYKLSKFVLIFLFSSLIDIIGISLIAQFIISILNPEKLTNYDFLFLLNYFNEEQLVTVLGLILLSIFTIKTFLSIFIRWYIKKLSLNIYRQIQGQLMSAYQRLNFEEFISRNLSEYIRNIKDLSQGCAASSDVYLKILSEVLILIVITIYLLSVSYIVVMFSFFIFFLVFLFYQIKLKPINIKLGEQNILSIKQLNKFIDAGLRGLKEIRVISKENFILENIKKFNYVIYNTNLKSSLISESPRYILELLVIFCIVSVILTLKFNSNEFILLIPNISIFLFGALRILPGFATILSGITVLHHNKEAITHVYYDLLEIKKKKIRSKFKFNPSK